VKYKFRTRIVEVREHEAVERGEKGADGQAVLTMKSLGWYAMIASDPPVSFWVGDSKPDMVPGPCTITIETGDLE